MLREITNEAGMTEAYLDDHTMVLLNIDWAGNNQVMRNDADEFARDWQYSAQSRKTNFYSVDLTGDPKRRFLKMPFPGEWIDSDSRISRPTRQELDGTVFVRRGGTIDVVSDSDYFTSNVLTLTELTRQNILPGRQVTSEYRRYRNIGHFYSACNLPCFLYGESHLRSSGRSCAPVHGLTGKCNLVLNQ